MPYRLHPEAQEKLEAAFEFYEAEAGLELAKDFASEVHRVAEL